MSHLIVFQFRSYIFLPKESDRCDGKVEKLNSLPQQKEFSCLHPKSLNTYTVTMQDKRILLLGSQVQGTRN